jgi:uncharacterized protein YndB with AHSA1/START domain
MKLTIKPASINKTLVVRAAPERAFEVFTAGFDRWWPRTHYIGASPLVRAIIEPQVGGRWYSVHENGAEGLWGEVLAWEPPQRLVLAWRINHEWGYDPNLLTEVEVRFSARDGGGTQVDFEHRYLERMGDAPAVADTIDSMKIGWGMILAQFKEAAETSAPP